MAAARVAQPPRDPSLFAGVRSPVRELMDELTASLVLARVPSLDARVLRDWLTRFGHFTELAAASPAALRSAGIPASVITALARAKQDVDADRCWLEADDHHFIAWHDERFPALLHESTDPPV